MAERITTRIVKDPEMGWKIEVHINGRWCLKRWTAGTKADARKAATEVRKEMELIESVAEALSPQGEKVR